MRHKCVLGLIGGIGSGKSVVAAELARRGAAVIVADELGHQALRQPDVKEALLGRWGAGIADTTGELDRKAIARIVFNDAVERQFLEALVFPHIERGIAERIRAANDDAAVRLIVLDAAILLETGWRKACDRIIYVHTPRSQRLERLARQRGWGEEEIRRRSAAQMPLADKVSRADFVVDNSGPPEHLKGQLDRLMRRIDDWA